MCTIDWNAVAAWVTAIATFGLLVVGIAAALYAKRASDSALESLRLESEPVLMVSIEPFKANTLAPHEPPESRPGMVTQLKQLPNGVLIFGPAQQGISEISTMLFVVQNVGRSPALNVEARLVATPEHDPVGGKVPDPASVPVFIQGLAPQGRFGIVVHNGTAVVCNFTISDATRASATEGKRQPAKMFTSTALPFPI